MSEEQTQQPEEQKETKCECAAGAPAWMVTYSDLVTLLLTFFVLLLSMASMDPVKFTEASSSIKDAFGIHAAPSHIEYAIPVLPSPPITQFSPIELQKSKEMYEKIKAQIDTLRLSDEIGVLRRDDNSIVLRVKDKILFKPGQATISPKSYPTLRTVAEIIRPLPMDLRIEGHTDDRPVSKSSFGNWELSVDRAVSVLRFFTRGDLLPLDRMSAIGYGKSRPAVPNRDEATRALNRRVDFVLRLNTSEARQAASATKKSMPL
ncbi:chemotaxis protein MotB [Desulfomarina profundi]|uniref:Chemotaxis protein MotB n=1 Tax=Desulfomarina profundi TaxID=2772557 RepID=A0A8D5FVE3_9BACT|nr:flagellar motor protein MotB [Desulfomarina profundi]BCL60602.1 chemotaxis protein MotB [Desulfomarina profundi]